MYSDSWRDDADVEEFWSLIELARENADSYVEKLREMDRRALICFAWLHEEFASLLHRPEILEHLDCTDSEDALQNTFEDMVGMGRHFYESLAKNPKLVADAHDDSEFSYRIPYEFRIAFRERFGTEVPPFGYDY